MCLPALVHPAKLQMYPSRVSSSESCFDMRILYKDSQDWQHALGVHIAPEVAHHFLAGEVVGFSVEPLQANSAAALAFPSQPSYVVLGIELREGLRLNCVPRPLKLAHYKYQLLTAVSLVMCGVLTLTLQPVATAALAALTTHFWKTARGIPCKPAW